MVVEDEFVNVLTVYEVDTTGFYRQVYNETWPINICLNNGKRFGGIYTDETRMAIGTFQLDATNQPTQSGLFFLQESIYSGKLTLDDTLLIGTPTTAYVYTFNGTEWNLHFSFDAPFTSAPLQSTFLFETSVITFNQSNQLVIWTRQPDKTYEVTDSLTFNPDYNLGNYNVWHDGVDTIVLTWRAEFPGEAIAGYAVFYTKVNQEWIETFVTAANLGYATGGRFGINLAQFGEYIMLGASEERDAPSRGVVTLMKRGTDHKWTPFVDIRSEDEVAFARTSGVSSLDLVFESCIDAGFYEFCNFYTVPRCTFEPVNVTCLSVQVDTCTFDAAALTTYTVYDPARCGLVNVTLESGAFKNSTTFEVNYSFSRLLSEPVKCTAQISCPLPEAPTSNPTAAPGATNTPTKTTSSAKLASISLVALFVVGVALI